MADQFRVLISGRTIAGVPLTDLKAEVGRAFKLQGEQLDRMLSGRPMVVSRACSGEAAEKLHARLQALGLEARIEPLVVDTPTQPLAPEPELPAAQPAGADELFSLAAPAAVPAVASAGGVSGTGEPVAPPAAGMAEVVCPKCGEAQPKRTLCRKCGLDMPRFLAAQEALEKEAREERAANIEARKQAPGRGRGAEVGRERHAGILGLSFSGRFGRLDYLAGSLFALGIWLAFVLLAVSTGKIWLGGLGLFFAAIYGLRVIALRLHDTGRTGWLTLIALVPVIGALMSLILLFIGGWEEENDYGPATLDGGGIRLILVILLMAGLTTMSYRSMTQSPEKALLFAAAMSVGQSKAAADEAPDDAMPEPAAPVRYASNNRIDIYVVSGCSSCDQMRSWLDANGLRYTVYSVDSDQGAAERLHSITSGNGESRTMLPVLEVNGKVLPGDPDPDDVHRHLRQESS